MTSAATLSTAFETLTQNPCRPNEHEFTGIYNQFMSERAEHEIIADSKDVVYYNILLSHASRMLIAATATPETTVSPNERVEIIENTASALNNLPGLSGRKRVRSALRSLERFYQHTVNHQEPRVLAHKSPEANMPDKLTPITLDCFSRAQDLRCWNTANLASKSTLEVMTDKIEIVALHAFSMLGTNEATARYLQTQVSGEQAYGPR